MNTPRPFLLACLSIFLSFTLFAQQSVPNQFITYDQFLKECIDFKKQTNIQEVWVVHFWADFDGKSMEQIRPIKALFDRYQNKPVRFVSASIQKVHANWMKSLKRHNMPWEQLNIPREDDLSFIKRAFRYGSLPALFVVDQQGMVRRMKDVNELQTFLQTATTRLPDRPYYKASGTSISNVGSNNSSNANTNNGNDTPNDDGWVIHVVQPGETLFGLYRKYGVKVDEIKRLNGLTDNTIKVGQRLKIKK